MSMMRRVTKANRCTVCNHDTWCLVGKTVCICMRVQSDRRKEFQGGEVGWIHPLNGSHPILPSTPEPPRPPVINTGKLMREWGEEPKCLALLAAELGVSIKSLELLEFVKAPWSNAWGVPMQDGYGNYIGIRVRNLAGNKWAQPGSHAGIFIPKMPVQSMCVIVEGPTDAAAAIDMGFYPIGRPSCSGGVPHILAAVKRLKIQKACIICDNDDPGIRGASDLQRWLTIPSCMLVLPTKDLREFKKIGDKETVDAMISQLVWTQPRKAA